MTPELTRFLIGHPETWPTPAPKLEGKYLAFRYAGERAHEASYTVISRRGGFEMGRIEWSPQWRAFMFRPHFEAVFPMSALAEVYAYLKGLGGRQV